MASQRIILDTGPLAIGRFVCPPGDARWSRENWIGPDHHVVFPARAVVIEQAGVGRLVANPNHAVMYDPGRTYRRRLVSPDGDLATFVVLRDALAQEILGEAPGGGPAPFSRPDVWLDATVLLRLHLLARAIEEGRADHVAAEETVLEVIAYLIGQAGSGDAGAGSGPSRRSTRDAHREVVEDAKAVLSASYAERRSLAELAGAVGTSPFHLARIFRAHTGQSLRGYREQLRLRAALDRLTRPAGPTSLALLAAELGFASHSHLDARFRRAFGRAPADVRASVRSPVRRRPHRARQLRTILQGAVPRPA